MHACVAHRSPCRGVLRRAQGQAILSRPSQIHDFGADCRRGAGAAGRGGRVARADRAHQLARRARQGAKEVCSARRASPPRHCGLCRAQWVVTNSATVSSPWVCPCCADSPCWNAAALDVSGPCLPSHSPSRPPPSACVLSTAPTARATRCTARTRPPPPPARRGSSSRGCRRPRAAAPTPRRRRRQPRPMWLRGCSRLWSGRSPPWLRPSPRLTRRAQWTRCMHHQNELHALAGGYQPSCVHHAAWATQRLDARIQ
jgi:hypothetical protein